MLSCFDEFTFYPIRHIRYHTAYPTDTRRPSSFVVPSGGEWMFSVSWFSCASGLADWLESGQASEMVVSVDLPAKLWRDPVVAFLGAG